MPLHDNSSNLSSCSRGRESDAPSRAEASSYFDLCSEAAPAFRRSTNSSGARAALPGRGELLLERRRSNDLAFVDTCSA